MPDSSGALDVDGPQAGAGDRLVARAPLFYGWLMVPQVMVAHVLTTPGQTLGIAVFTGYLTSSLSVSETQLSGAYGLGTLLAALPLAALGAVMDRHGIRRTMALVAVLFGLACCYMSTVQSLWQLFVAFFLLRLLGQGALTLLAANTLGMWFRRRLGTVTGVASIGMVLAMGQLPPLIRILIERYGWRQAYVIMGMIVWAVLLPLLAISFRGRPEDVGLQPDGGAGPGGRGPHDHRRGPARDLLFREAARTRAYWLMAFTLATLAMVGTGMVFHAHRILAAGGIDAARADFALTALFTAIAVGQLIGGLLADRVRLNLLLAIGLAGLSASIGMLLAAPRWGREAYLVWGFGQGLLSAVGGTLWIRYFGAAHAGKIRGAAQTLAVAGSSAGPFVMGCCQQWTGSYAISLLIFLGILAPLAAAALFATPPRCESDCSGLPSGLPTAASLG